MRRVETYLSLKQLPNFNSITHHSTIWFPGAGGGYVCQQPLVVVLDGGNPTSQFGMVKRKAAPTACRGVHRSAPPTGCAWGEAEWQRGAGRQCGRGVGPAREGGALLQRPAARVHHGLSGALFSLQIPVTESINFVTGARPTTRSEKNYKKKR